MALRPPSALSSAQTHSQAHLEHSVSLQLSPLHFLPLSGEPFWKGLGASQWTRGNCIHLWAASAPSFPILISILTSSTSWTDANRESVVTSGEGCRPQPASYPEPGSLCSPQPHQQGFRAICQLASALHSKPWGEAARGHGMAPNVISGQLGRGRGLNISWSLWDNCPCFSPSALPLL